MSGRLPLPVEGFFALVMLTTLVEFVILFARPELLSRLAFIPIGRRVVALSPSAREALVERVMTTADYRTTPVESFEPGRLADPAAISIQENKKLFFTRGGDVVVSPTFTLMRKQHQVVRATLALEGDHIVVRARSYPAQVSFVILFLLFALFRSGAPPFVPFFFVAIVTAVTAIAIWRSSRVTLDQIAREVGLRAERLSRARVADASQVRIETGAPEAYVGSPMEEEEARGRRPGGSA